jgi:hypothetical protein
VQLKVTVAGATLIQPAALAAGLTAAAIVGTVASSLTVTDAVALKPLPSVIVPVTCVPVVALVR